MLGTLFTDLRTPTPLLFVDTYQALDCVTSTSTARAEMTAVLSATSYAAKPVTYSFIGLSSSHSLTYTFPELLMTLMNPGDVIRVVSLTTSLIRVEMGVRC